MASFKIPILFILVSFLNFATIQAQDPPTFIHQFCSSSNSTTTNSPFQLNLKTLLSSLSSNATIHADYYNTTIMRENPTDSVYGLFMCRGDVPSLLCQQCIQNAIQRLSAQCSLSKQAVIYYDECMVRYSDSSFFSTVSTIHELYMRNHAYVSNPESFMRLLFSTMNQTADEAARPPIGKRKYATKQPNLSGFQTLYCLAQCTPDLSPHDCRTCLSGVIGDLLWYCEGKEGGRVLNPSCNVRYELYPFYQSNGTSPTLVPESNGDQVQPPTEATPSPSHLTEKRRRQLRTIIFTIVPVTVSATLFFFCYYLIKMKGRKSSKTILRENFGPESATLKPMQFSMAVIEEATNYFSDENRIGKGGFGVVYKGILVDGRQIAVKRLSKNSRQGANEFKNEVLLIAKLQHKSLVTFIGFCLEEQEKILVYEYVPNNRLDYFLFDSKRPKLLSWFERYNIIRGIARGIIYLHEHSRLKVIHRDLKPSNVLLDQNMNPKISDFGLARIVEINQEQGSTNRIVGTFGYMSPEYAMLGQFSKKSDIFSFGVMVLEIITGKKNLSSHESHRVADGLLSYVWRHWRDQTPLNILDPSINQNNSQNEILKCIQIGLLCVQQDPDARPTMATIVSYLGSYSVSLSTPQEPAFFLEGRRDPKAFAHESSSNQSTKSSTSFSVNDMSMSNFLPR